MLKKIATSLFLLIYFSISSVSFAEEVMLEIVSETPSPIVEAAPAPVVENIPEEIISDTPPPEVAVPIAEPVVPEPVSEVVEPVVENPPISPETLPEMSEGTLTETTPEVSPIESLLDALDAAPEEAINEEIVVEIPTTEPPQVVEVEKNSIFTPPGPEPEPWQPPVREDPTTESNTPVGDTETQSDPDFLAENSVFTRRMAETVVVDRTAKHSCKVDVFRTDVSQTATSTLSVKFFGTSALATYDAEIGSLPDGIDVRFEKNNDYLYDFRGKETTLQLVVNNQDGSLTGDFTIPIIYTLKGKKESSVICQLNLVNEEEESPIVPIVTPIVEPVLDPAQAFIEEILDRAPESEPIIEIPTVIESVIPEVIPPVVLPVEPPAIVLPEKEQGPTEQIPESTPLPESDNNPIAPVIVEPEVVLPIAEPVVVESVIPDPVPEVIEPVVENPPAVEPISIPSSDVSST